MTSGSFDGYGSTHGTHESNDTGAGRYVIYPFLAHAKIISYATSPRSGRLADRGSACLSLWALSLAVGTQRSCAPACRSSTATLRVAGPVGAGHGDARRARHSDHPRRARARTSRAPPASCTRRIASSRWTSRAAAPPASCRRWSAPRALALDREIRLHRFRAEAQRALALHDAGRPRDARRLHGRRQRRPGGARRRARSNTCCCGRIPSPGAPKTACSWCCRCSSRCRTPTAPTSRRSARCATCCRRQMFEFLAAARDRMGRADRRRSRSRVPPIPGPTSTTCARDARAKRADRAAAPDVRKLDRIPSSRIPGSWDLGIESAASDSASAATTGRSSGTSDGRRRRAASPTTCT